MGARYSWGRFKLRRKKGVAVSVQTQRVTEDLSVLFVALTRIIPPARAVKKFFRLKMKSQYYAWHSTRIFLRSPPLSRELLHTSTHSRLLLRLGFDFGESRPWVDSHDFLLDNFSNKSKEAVCKIIFLKVQCVSMNKWLL